MVGIKMNDWFDYYLVFSMTMLVTVGGIVWHNFLQYYKETHKDK